MMHFIVSNSWLSSLPLFYAFACCIRWCACVRACVLSPILNMHVIKSTKIAHFYVWTVNAHTIPSAKLFFDCNFDGVNFQCTDYYYFFFVNAGICCVCVCWSLVEDSSLNYFAINEKKAFPCSTYQTINPFWEYKKYHVIWVWCNTFFPMAFSSTPNTKCVEWMLVIIWMIFDAIFDGGVPHTEEQMKERKMRKQQQRWQNDGDSQQLT